MLKRHRTNRRELYPTSHVISSDEVKSRIIISSNQHEILKSDVKFGSVLNGFDAVSILDDIIYLHISGKKSTRISGQFELISSGKDRRLKNDFKIKFENCRTSIIDRDESILRSKLLRLNYNPSIDSEYPYQVFIKNNDWQEFSSVETKFCKDISNLDGIFVREFKAESNIDFPSDSQPCLISNDATCDDIDKFSLIFAVHIVS